MADAWEVVSRKPAPAPVGEWEVKPSTGATVTGEFDPNIPSANAPIAMLGGRGITAGNAKDMQSAAKTGEEVLRTGAGIAATAATFTALAPAAAAVSLPAALIASATTGLTASVARQAVEHVLGGPDKSLKDRSIEAGVDTVLGAGGEGMVRTGNYLLKMGGQKVLLPLVARTAAATDKGLRILEDQGVKMMNGIRLMNKGAGDPKMSTREMLSTFNEKMAQIGTGHSKTFQDRFPDLLTAIHAAEGDVSKLVEIQGELSQFSYKGSGLKFEEKSGLKWLRDELSRKLGATMKQVHGEDGQALLSGLKENWNQVKKFSAGLDFTAETVKRMFMRSAPAMLGAGAGGYQGSKSGTMGGILGAAVGATAAETLARQVAPWVLQRMLTDKATGPIARQAINKMAQGEIEAGEKLFRRAVAQSGIREILEPMVKQQFIQEEAPNAAPAR